MKEGWEYKTLGEICKIYNGNSINADYKKKHFLGATGGLPFIATKDVSPLGTIDYNNGVRIPNYEEFKVAPANSVFICAEGGSAGKKFAYVEKDVCFGNKLFCITPKDKAIKGKFIYHFVQSDNFRGQFFSLLTGLIGGVSAKKFQTIEIPVPPLSEQQSIVDYLDSAFAKIDAMKANAEKALNEAKALFQASLKEMLEPKEGWEEKKIGDICEIIRGKRFVRTDIVDDGVPCIHYGDIYTHYGLSVKKTRGCISPELAKKMRFAEKNDVVVVQAGENNWDIGVGVAYFGDEPAAVHDACFILKHKQNPMYISYYLRSYNYHWYLVDFVHEGKICSFLKPALQNAPIPLPPLSEQQRIVATLDSLKSKVDRLQENNDKISQECDALKQAILRQVFE